MIKWIFYYFFCLHVITIPKRLRPQAIYQGILIVNLVSEVFMTSVFMPSDLERRLWKQSLKGTGEHEGCYFKCSIFTVLREMSAVVSIILLKSVNFAILASFYEFSHDNGLSYDIPKKFALFFTSFIWFFTFFEKKKSQKRCHVTTKICPIWKMSIITERQVPYKKRSVIWAFFPH